MTNKNIEISEILWVNVRNYSRPDGELYSSEADKARLETSLAENAWLVDAGQPRVILAGKEDAEAEVQKRKEFLENVKSGFCLTGSDKVLQLTAEEFGDLEASLAEKPKYEAVTCFRRGNCLKEAILRRIVLKRVKGSNIENPGFSIPVIFEKEMSEEERIIHNARENTAKTVGLKTISKAGKANIAFRAYREGVIMNRFPFNSYREKQEYFYLADLTKDKQELRDQITSGEVSLEGVKKEHLATLRNGETVQGASDIEAYLALDRKKSVKTKALSKRILQPLAEQHDAFIVRTVLKAVLEGDKDSIIDLNEYASSLNGVYAITDAD